MKYLDNPSRWRIASWIRDGCQNILAKVKEIQGNCDRAPADGYIARMFEFASKPERPTNAAQSQWNLNYFLVSMRKPDKK